MNECITSKKKPPKLYKGQHFFGFQLARAAPVLLEAGGKPSTRFPPGGLVELTCMPEAHEFHHVIFYSKIMNFEKS